ncbi:Diacylglycerol O-acyltransferase [Fusarium keratoplasticum]|uniref:Diacylglycerol O-acyltransferase n=1 Tax=Fusarium keratoplasticum TaxID=1328300 RepID=A0ACC0RG51_9HYPO|nr:Diacylglycerol O-acyltransferase [Fusarium keratoplasticum]KAI8683834.1 Diacylglycerol O-acyltransferase [Fusarium keratoplasticum]KAI8687948.1 Diacylglycerol O-acyltransferase [Fusarium keratoplasticum]
MASPEVDGGISIENGAQPSETNEKVTTIPNPESNEPIEPEQPETREEDATADNGNLARPEMEDGGDLQSTISTSNGDFDDVTLSPSNGATKSYAAVAGGKDEKDTRYDEDWSYPKLPIIAESQQRERANWRAGGIRFAPLRVPMARRLQTAAVLFHCMSIILLVSIFWLICANPLTWPILVPYLIHLTLSTAASNGRLSYRSEWFRSLRLWKLFTGYFPMKLHKTFDLPADRKYIFGYHPHGIISHGAWGAFATNALGFRELFPGITNTLLTLDSNFRLPFNRDWILWMGLQSVSKESIWNMLTKGGPNNDGQGRAVTIVVGGARESLEAQPGTLRLILKGRKGFVKMALRTGADLVPVIGFGENDLYDQLSPKTHPIVHQMQMIFLKVFKFTVPALHGRGVLNYDVGLMPYRRPVNIVIGRPLRVERPHGPQPAQEDIDELHERYIREVEKLWEAYKDQFSPDRKAEMEIFA